MSAVSAHWPTPLLRRPPAWARRGHALLADLRRPVVRLVGPDVAQVGDHLLAEQVVFWAATSSGRSPMCSAGDQLADPQLVDQLAQALAHPVGRAGDDVARARRTPRSSSRPLAPAPVLGIEFVARSAMPQAIACTERSRVARRRLTNPGSLWFCAVEVPARPPVVLRLRLLVGRRDSRSDLGEGHAVRVHVRRRAGRRSPSSASTIGLADCRPENERWP